MLAPCDPGHSQSLAGNDSLPHHAIISYIVGVFPNSTNTSQRSVTPQLRHIDGGCDESTFDATYEFYFPSMRATHWPSPR